ncbi:hypothetical protein Pcinc_021173 [Petrolisthes cinctipes]|uniref:PiggyBac transposable element-derived protein domain-containing protein n=1 Tax=Petrolisthes cinctipes TaxID=88211 RepID=A0AAE1FIQ5_PETCI|nr:hypothetical protein Pcinc_021173 [Petrolisthes cinctipes]
MASRKRRLDTSCEVRECLDSLLSSEEDDLLEDDSTTDSSGGELDREHELPPDSDEEMQFVVGERTQFPSSTPKKPTLSKKIPPTPTSPIPSPTQQQPGPSHCREPPATTSARQQRGRRATRATSRDTDDEEFDADNPQPLRVRRRPSITGATPRASRSRSRSRRSQSRQRRSQTSSSHEGEERIGRHRRKVSPHPDLIVDLGADTMSSNCGFEWQCQPSHTRLSRTLSRNIIHEAPGPTVEAQGLTECVSVFELFFPDNIILEIVQRTNQKIAIYRQAYKKKDASVADTNPLEIRALIGILLLAGVQRSNHLNYLELWHSRMGSPPYKAAMSSTRFAFLINSLRFDNPDTRQEHRRTDRFAPVRSIWDSFIERCRWMYTPGENLTIDEQLLAFRGRAVFRMYIPKKPAKYGLKLILCCDNKSKYLLGAIPYVGKQEPPPQGDLSLGHYYVRQLTRPYHQNDGAMTDEDSGEEDNVDISNLPATQLTSFAIIGSSEVQDSVDENVEMQEECQKRKKIKLRQWKVQDIPEKNMCS